MTYHLERGWIPLHDAVGVNYGKGTTTDIKAVVPRIRTKLEVNGKI